MRKFLKPLGIVVLSVAVTLAVTFGIFMYGQREQPQDYIRDDNLFWDNYQSGFLCEWHYPATNGVPGHVVVFYTTSRHNPRCYRIEGNRVTDYHVSKEGGCFRKEIDRIKDPEHWRRESAPQHEKDLVPEEFDLRYQERWRVHAVREFEAQTRLFEAQGAGHVAVLAWEWKAYDMFRASADWVNTGLCAVAFYPLDQASPAVNALRDAVKEFMDDPSTRWCYADYVYVRGYPVLSPEHPNRIPVRKGGKTPDYEFRASQHDLLEFIPCMERELIPIKKGVNPFKGLKTPFAPGNSVTLNYRFKGKDNIWYLNGDNFWRVEVYGGLVVSD